MFSFDAPARLLDNELMMELIYYDPSYINLTIRPTKQMIDLALALDSLSYTLPLRLKDSDKISRTCCEYHNNRDIRRGYKSKETSNLRTYCYPKDLEINKTDYSHLKHASKYYGEDIDLILEYARKDITILLQVDDDLCDELEELILKEQSGIRTFFINLFEKFGEKLMKIYG